MKNKKAVSFLVATILLILITVSAVAIIWVAIMPMMDRAMEIGQARLECNEFCYSINQSISDLDFENKTCTCYIISTLKTENKSCVCHTSIEKQIIN